MKTSDLTRHHFLPHLYLKELNLPAGATVIGHAHTYDHMSVLAAGSVRVRYEGGLDEEFTAPAYIMLHAGRHHAITALSDAVWYCQHVTDENDPSRIDEVLIQGADHAIL